jgi:hypothetical protein
MACEENLNWAAWGGATKSIFAQLSKAGWPQRMLLGHGKA